MSQNITREELAMLAGLVPESEIHTAGMFLRYLIASAAQGDNGKKQDAAREEKEQAVLALSPHGWKKCRHCQSEALKPLILIQAGKRDFWGFHMEAAWCESCGAGQMEALERDSYDQERPELKFIWYLLGRDEMEQLRNLVQRCPNPASYRCTCDIHKALRAACDSLSESADENAKEQEFRVAMMVKKELPYFKTKR